MRFSKAWIVATKDFSTFRKKKSVIYSIVLFPLFVSIGLPLVVRFAGQKSGGIPAVALPGLLNSFSFFFIIGAAILPTAIASYSLVGEKVEKSLEPLLATPTTDGEILLGKSFAAFLPPIVGIYVGAAIFMALMDRLTYSTLGYLYFPNWSMGVILLLLAPLSSILSVELNIIISARVNDVRAAQQLGSIVVLPFAGIYVAGEIGLISLETNNLLIISAILVVIDVILFYVSTATFRREEILTKWK
jgi:ABC-type Na+ efflux pump permease subunit